VQHAESDTSEGVYLSDYLLIRFRVVVSSYVMGAEVDDGCCIIKALTTSHTTCMSCQINGLQG